MSSFGSEQEGQLLAGSMLEAPQMQLKPYTSIRNECQVQHVVWLGRTLLACGDRSPEQGRPGNIETTGVCENVALLFCCETSFKGYITIVKDKHLDGASRPWNGSKGHRFPSGANEKRWKF